MTIGKSSRKSSVRSSIRAPKFLDKASGFYGRLDEPEVAGEEEEQGRWSVTEENVRKDISEADQREEINVFDFNEGMMEDDGKTLLQRNTSRRSSRWRRSSRRKQKEGKAEEDATQDKTPSLGTESSSDPHVLENTGGMMEVEMEKLKKMDEEKEQEGRGTEPTLVHFTVREDRDDQVLIRDKKRGREEEGEEERKMKREQEEGMKMVKRNSVKNYRKAFDRAFRRGWEAFITNLYSVTLTPVTSSSSQSSSPASKKKEQHCSVLAEFQ
ncbi:cilia- and flagella-associated protein 251 [Notolabrus celidotus]|uniref:cilia- and flagella-associated protein 251 n=1 Tax=Notolabrus celidotus TaxID=1203425 RepID=UPI00148FEFF1|nr:cilia- and flagella-associated protein 251 [Notolabrus celidotus]